MAKKKKKVQPKDLCIVFNNWWVFLSNWFRKNKVCSASQKKTREQNWEVCSNGKNKDDVFAFPN